MRCGSLRLLTFFFSGSPTFLSFSRSVPFPFSFSFAADAPSFRPCSPPGFFSGASVLVLWASRVPSFLPQLPPPLRSVAVLAPLLLRLEEGGTTRSRSRSFETGKSSKASSSVPSPYDALDAERRLLSGRESVTAADGRRRPLMKPECGVEGMRGDGENDGLVGEFGRVGARAFEADAIVGRRSRSDTDELPEGVG